MGALAPPEKKQKRPIPLETKLETLQRTLAGLLHIWTKYDPGVFMEEMRDMRKRKRIDELTPEAIEHFVATETDDTDSRLRALDTLDRALLGESMASQPLEYQQDMSDYVRRVRGCSEGQS